MTTILMINTMPDILYEPYRLETASVMAQLVDFGLTHEQIITLLQIPTCMLAGGAAANIFYNYLHTEAQKPLEPHADLDFWMHDPHIDDSHHPGRTHMYIEFKHTLECAGYVQHQRHLPIEVWYQRAFAVQGDTKIRCNWWVHPVSRKRIQLIFTSTPPEQTLLNFDLPVCRAAVTAKDGIFQLQWTGQCEKVMRDHMMLVPFIEDQTILLQYRIAKYAERYNIKIML